MSKTMMMIIDSLKRDVDRLEQQAAKARRRPTDLPDYESRIATTERQLGAARDRLAAKVAQV